MRRILVVGAGHSGLQLALGLQAHGYDVTVMTERTPDEIRAGRVSSTQMMFPSQLALEAAQGLDLWDAQVPKLPYTGFTIPGPDGVPFVDWLGDMGGSESVDQRVKMSTWLELFARRGGHLVLHPVSVGDIDWYSRNFDLVVVAAGKGELVTMFDRDHERSIHTEPQRRLAVSYVHGVAHRPEVGEKAVHLNVIPGIGELYYLPGLTVSGPCEIILVEAIPGGPLDRFAGVRDPREHWARTLELIRTYAPWDYERTRGAELTDELGVLSGAFTPVVRHPVAELPSGGIALGIADVVVANDPITGQGANSAARAAAVYLAAIVEHGDRPFDRDWMQQTFERFWDYARHSVKFTTALLAPPPEHVVQLLAAGNEHQAVADRVARAIDTPSDFENFLYEPDKTHAYLREIGAMP
ncbi:styrene monooxygenase/indole monooxygenase family protein [Streptomyces sp. SID3343]|uniref:styrene monooxygenase/indole monooxygenase family protein n=1 Tax=Streptomyces sp. SID3343 TaxID=2690260 RepID=UPI001371D569|nr:styrene monooxygenase/indole monooxygenase family protein [Streptomyces sp. SID3343]MYW00002.1 FAD-binding oxidoreductase [Streptomyces sp. SID3343]